jgi:arylsulfatase A-like enzyme
MKRFQTPFILTFTVMVLMTSMTFAQAEKPNVVFMLADNVGWGDIGAHGGGEIRGMPTPNIDRLAAEVCN